MSSCRWSRRARPRTWRVALMHFRRQPSEEGHLISTFPSRRDWTRVHHRDRWLRRFLGRRRRISDRMHPATKRGTTKPFVNSLIQTLRGADWHWHLQLPRRHACLLLLCICALLPRGFGLPSTSNAKVSPSAEVEYSHFSPLCTSAPPVSPSLPHYSSHPVIFSELSVASNRLRNRNNID